MSLQHALSPALAALSFSCSFLMVALHAFVIDTPFVSTGRIPRDLGEMTALRQLWLSYNGLSGELRSHPVQCST